MRFSPSLVTAKFIRRYKRFLADVLLKNGEQITVHCPNSGSMKTCLGENWPVAISDSQNPKRKYRFTLEMIDNGKSWIGINTILANQIVYEAIQAGLIKELQTYDKLEREVRYGQNSRIDILHHRGDFKTYVEIKNVTMIGDDGFNVFPDAQTTRGLKHLNELSQMVEQGHRAVMFYLVQRSDGYGFRPAREIDPAYADGLQKAVRAGVEIFVYRADISPQEIKIVEKIDTIEF